MKNETREVVVRAPSFEALVQAVGQLVESRRLGGWALVSSTNALHPDDRREFAHAVRLSFAKAAEL